MGTNPLQGPMEGKGPEPGDFLSPEMATHVHKLTNCVSTPTYVPVLNRRFDVQEGMLRTATPHVYDDLPGGTKFSTNKTTTTTLGVKNVYT
jgi:hypothetical protein